MLERDCRRGDVLRHIAALNVKFLDLLLLHWPTAAALRDHWSALIALKQRGLVRSLGLANVDVRQLQMLEAPTVEQPVVVQVGGK